MRQLFSSDRVGHMEPCEDDCIVVGPLYGRHYLNQFPARQSSEAVKVLCLHKAMRWKPF